LECLGAKFIKGSDNVVVHGTGKPKLKSNTIYCNESGSTIRFLIPIFSLTGKEMYFTGEEGLLKRPQSIYQEIFDEDNNTFIQEETKITVKGSIKARTYVLKGNVSSQFFSGLMFALPLLKEDSYIIIDGDLESKSYINLTIDMLSHFGITIKEIENGYFIKGEQKYSPKDYRVEGDYSQAAFYLVGGVIGGTIKIKDIPAKSSQGDKAIINIIQSMNGKIIFTENGFNSVKSNTVGTTIDIKDCPDIGPIVALLASVSKGTTRIINAHRLRIKESDRIESTVSSLKQLGANIDVDGDDIIIQGKKSLDGPGGILDSFNDHRIAMMLGIASSVYEVPFTIKNADSVNKSYPHFFEDLKSIGGKLIIKE
jgi:3-phosphoshikimate 1-carboxyvinyltransferase